MTPPLFLLDPGALAAAAPGALVALTGEEGRHAARVRRLTAGEAVVLADGRGRVGEGTVAAVVPDGLSVRLERVRDEPAPDPRLVLVQALPKGERAELAVEAATELGVDEVVPWQAARSVARWDGPRADRGVARWRRTAAEAAKQSRRAWVPDVGALAGTAAIAARCRAAACALVLHESATAPLAAAELPWSGEVVVVVGPEGGLDPDELAALSAVGAQAVRLGTPVLRTSTAGAAALAALSLRLGRWD